MQENKNYTIYCSGLIYFLTNWLMNLFSHYAELYRNELLENVVPFWLKNSPDKEYGGYYTCLDRDGAVYDTDKFIWLQGRQVWCFSMLYNEVEQKEEWKDMALLGADFLEKYGRDAEGNWYFSLTREGKPLVQPYNIFSDCFAVMAFSELYKITREEKHKQLAVKSFDNILTRKDNWKGQYNKQYPGTRPLKNFALPMILANLAKELEHLLGESYLQTIVPALLKELLDEFYRPDFGVILENISPEGQFVDSFDGRLLNPGHAIEAMWFVMDLGKRLNDPSLIERATDIMLQMLDHGWDKEHGGIFYFMDVLNRPVQQLEWDQKLWWVHVEALVALAKGYAYTGREECLRAFEKVHVYTWQHFRDTAHGEWYGYLHRDGTVLLPLKGGKWKGCFHIPRALCQVWKTMESLSVSKASSPQDMIVK